MLATSAWAAISATMWWRQWTPRWTARWTSSALLHGPAWRPWLVRPLPSRNSGLAVLLPQLLGGQKLFDNCQLLSQSADQLSQVWVSAGLVFDISQVLRKSADEIVELLASSAELVSSSARWPADCLSGWHDVKKEQKCGPR